MLTFEQEMERIDHDISLTEEMMKNVQQSIDVKNQAEYVKALYGAKVDLIQAENERKLKEEQIRRESEDRMAETNAKLEELNIRREELEETKKRNRQDVIVRGATVGCGALAVGLSLIASFASATQGSFDISLLDPARELGRTLFRRA